MIVEVCMGARGVEVDDYFCNTCLCGDDVMDDFGNVALGWSRWTITFGKKLSRFFRNVHGQLGSSVIW